MATLLVAQLRGMALRRLDTTLHTHRPPAMRTLTGARVPAPVQFHIPVQVNTVIPGMVRMAATPLRMLPSVLRRQRAEQYRLGLQRRMACCTLSSARRMS